MVRTRRCTAKLRQVTRVRSSAIRTRKNLALPSSARKRNKRITPTLATTALGAITSSFVAVQSVRPVDLREPQDSVGFGG
jgi:hypothetical protein